MTRADQEPGENRLTESDADSQAVGHLFDEHRDRLKLMVRLRMDQRLRGRIDASDVLQEAYVEALERYPDFLQDRPMPLFLWLRFIAVQKLHLDSPPPLGDEGPRRRARDFARTSRCRRSRRKSWRPNWSAGTRRPARRRCGRKCRPACKKPWSRMNPIDREILALRHFEQLTNLETAQVLGLKEATASQRYGRALLRLKDLLLSLPGFTELQP